MPYEAGKPWDASLSYSYGQTCTYKGLPYLWFHATENSTAGTKPNVEMKSFSASDGTTTVSRDERAWVLCSNDSPTFPIYGVIGDTIKGVRNLPAAPGALIFESPQGIKSLAAKVDTSPVSYGFYGWIAGMSVDYKSGQLYVGTYAGDRDNAFEAYYPRPDQQNQFLPDVVYVDEDSSGLTLKASWGAGVNDNIAYGGADTVGNLIWFERTYNFTLFVKWYDSSDNLISTVTADDSITSPSIADGWAEGTPTYSSEHTLARPSTAAYGYYGITHGTITPALDS